MDVRPTLEDLQLRAANGVFEMKEHLIAIGVGLLPAWAFEFPLALPLCFAATFAPRLYVGLRLKAHRARKLRCDWLG